MKITSGFLVYFRHYCPRSRPAYPRSFFSSFSIVLVASEPLLQAFRLLLTLSLMEQYYSFNKMLRYSRFSIILSFLETLLTSNLSKKTYTAKFEISEILTL